MGRRLPNQQRSMDDDDDDGHLCGRAHAQGNDEDGQTG
jgi:hypothetical protein